MANCTQYERLWREGSVTEHVYTRLKARVKSSAEECALKEFIVSYTFVSKPQINRSDLSLFPLSLPRYDAFTSRSTAQYSLAFEKASTIFNIASTLSAIASSQNRSEPDGRKRSFNFFQASAGMFSYINDNFLHAPSTDLSRDTVKLMVELMLAQAQECFLENSLREKKKDALIAKLASHTAWAYGTCVDGLAEGFGKGIYDKAWLTVCQVWTVLIFT